MTIWASNDDTIVHVNELVGQMRVAAGNTVTAMMAYGDAAKVLDLPAMRRELARAALAATEAAKHLSDASSALADIEPTRSG